MAEIRHLAKDHLEGLIVVDDEEEILRTRWPHHTTGISWSASFDATVSHAAEYASEGGAKTTPGDRSCSRRLRMATSSSVESHG